MQVMRRFGGVLAVLAVAAALAGCAQAPAASQIMSGATISPSSEISQPGAHGATTAATMPLSSNAIYRPHPQWTWSTPEGWTIKTLNQEGLSRLTHKNGCELRTQQVVDHDVPTLSDRQATDRYLTQVTNALTGTYAAAHVTEGPGSVWFHRQATGDIVRASGSVEFGTLAWEHTPPGGRNRIRTDLALRAMPRSGSLMIAVLSCPATPAATAADSPGRALLRGLAVAE